jgi:hypothetical protein
MRARFCVRVRSVPNSNQMEGEEASEIINDSVLSLEFAVTVLETGWLV